MNINEDFLNSRYFIINKKLQIFVGIWPYQNPVKSYIMQSIFVFIIIISCIPQIISLSIHLYKDIDKVIRNAVILMYLTAILFKLITAIITRGKMQLIYEKISENWQMFNNIKEKKLLLKYSEVGRLMTVGYCGLVLMGTCVFVAIPYVVIMFDIFFPIKNGTRPRLYLYDGEYLIDKEKNYHKIFVYEAFTGCVVIPVFVTIDTTYTVCVQQCIALLAVVRFRLKNATKDFKQNQCLFWFEKNDVAYDSVIKSINLHKVVLSFAEILESSYSTSFFICIVYIIIGLSIGTLLILVNLMNPYELFRYAIILVAAILHYFYISWPGQQLIDSSGRILFAAYDNQWYECSIKTQKLLYFMMLQCRNPCKLTAGGVYVMNFQNFATVLYYMNLSRTQRMFD